MDDRVTFEEEVGRALDDLYTGALLLTRDRDGAESLVIETVADAFQARSRAPGGDGFLKWIVRRMVRRQLELSDGEASAPRAEGEKPGHDRRPTPDALEALLRRLGALEAEDPDGLGRLIRFELQKLPLLDRAAVWLVTVLGFTYAETASVLRIDSSGVREHVFRGRRELQLRLGRALRDRTTDNQSSLGRLGGSAGQGGR